MKKQQLFFFILLLTLWSCSLQTKKSIRQLSSNQYQEYESSLWKRAFEKYNLKGLAFDYQKNKKEFHKNENKKIKVIASKLKKSSIFSEKPRETLHGIQKFLVFDKEILETMEEKVLFFEFMAELLQINHFPWNSRKVLLANDDVAFQGSIGHTLLFRSNGKIYKGIIYHEFRRGEDISGFLSELIPVDTFHFTSLYFLKEIFLKYDEVDKIIFFDENGFIFINETLSYLWSLWKKSETADFTFTDLKDYFGRFVHLLKSYVYVPRYSAHVKEVILKEDTSYLIFMFKFNPKSLVDSDEVVIFDKVEEKIYRGKVSKKSHIDFINLEDQENIFEYTGL